MTTTTTIRLATAGLAVLALGLAACGSDGGSDGGSDSGAKGGAPSGAHDRSTSTPRSMPSNALLPLSTCTTRRSPVVMATETWVVEPTYTTSTT